MLGQCMKSTRSMTGCSMAEVQIIITRDGEHRIVVRGVDITDLVSDVVLAMDQRSSVDEEGWAVYLPGSRALDLNIRTERFEIITEDEPASYPLSVVDDHYDEDEDYYCPRRWGNGG